MRKVIVTIDPETADVELRVEGVAGPSCKALTRDIEEAIGKVTKDTKTKDYATPEKAKVHSST
jgi:hypothetical protein